MADTADTDAPVAVSPLAGKPAPPELLVDLSRLERDYYERRPDVADSNQLVRFGTSGHRGSSLTGTFTEAHVLAITQAICDYRAAHGTDGPLYLGKDTHALSAPAQNTALEVLAANRIDAIIQRDDGVTPTPVISRAILVHNRGRTSHFADGIVITPSHNPPEDGGFKYNPLEGGPAGTDITRWIEDRANALLKDGNRGVKRVTLAAAKAAPTTHHEDLVLPYVRDLVNVVDMEAIRASQLTLGVDPLGGAGVHYWPAIAERYKLDLTRVNDVVDQTFRFMTVDWNGKIRTDPSSAYAMQRLIALKDRFTLAFACDADHDRHGIVTRSSGLLPPNHYLAVMIDHLFRNRPQWRADAGVGKTIVSSSMIDKVTAKARRPLLEVPVGFKWFVPGLVAGSLGCCGEESAGATFLRRDGTVWTTDKDGIVPALLAAEITAVAGRDPGEIYELLTREFGEALYDRVEAPATADQKRRLGALSAAEVRCTELAGETVLGIISAAPGNHAPIGGVKVSSATGWFAARPSGTEDIYKIYAETFGGRASLERIVAEAEAIVGSAIATERTAG